MTAFAAAANAVAAVLQYRLLALAIAGVLFERRDLSGVWPLLWPIPAIILARGALAWLMEEAAALAAARVKQPLRAALLDRLLAAGPVRLAHEAPGDLAATLVEGIEALDAYYIRFLPAMNTAMLVPLIILAVVLPADWPSGLILLLTAPLIPLFMVLIGRGAERLNQRQWALLARMSAHFLEAVQGLVTLKLFNASRREAAAIARISEDYRLATMRVLRVAFLSALALEFFATVSIALVAVLIGFRLMWGEMDFARGFFVLLLAPEFYLPLRALGGAYHARMEAVGVADRLAALLATEVPPAPGSPVPPPGRAPRIVFCDVGLTYGDGRPALSGIDVALEPGSLTALVGPSGAGKSSLAALLLRFVEPTAGRLLIDDQPLTAFDPAAWRARIGWVPQTPYLFRGTIADNLRLGRATATDAELAAAARATGAADFIETLPRGYAQPIGERGDGLSGGQARLIALTRAMLRQGPLLLLDEPTASLDAWAEERAQAALAGLAAGRTTLIIAHRLATVRAADRILVLEHGRLIEAGRHEDLLAAGGLYAGLVAKGNF